MKHDSRNHLAWGDPDSRVLRGICLDGGGPTRPRFLPSSLQHPADHGHPAQGHDKDKESCRQMIGRWVLFGSDGDGEIAEKAPTSASSFAGSDGHKAR